MKRNRIIKNRPTIPPLPVGERRGEGEPFGRQLPSGSVGTARCAVPARKAGGTYAIGVRNPAVRSSAFRRSGERSKASPCRGSAIGLRRHRCPPAPTAHHLALRIQCEAIGRQFPLSRRERAGVRWNRSNVKSRAGSWGISMILESRIETMNRDSSLAIPNRRTMILPLLGERAGVRARSLQPRHEALINRFMERVNLSHK